MLKLSVLSERGYMHWPSWDVVYEWEDEIVNTCGIEIKTFREGIIGKFVRRGIRERNKYFCKNLQYKLFDRTKLKLLFVMSSTIYRDLPTKNIIPIFLDFPVKTIEQIAYATKELPVFFVTCVDIFNKLNEIGVENVRYMPLSIADKHCVENTNTKEKSVDVIQFGRKNELLHSFMLHYCEGHPDTEYVYQTTDGSLIYYSTTRGNLGKFDSRSNYLGMIGHSKVSLVSSPGIDKGRSEEFGNIDFITPRFYESAALHCHMIGRYTKNAETEMLQLDTVCPYVDSYEELERLLDLYLHEESCDWMAQEQFIEENKTSKRAKYIQTEIEKCLM